MNTKQLKRLIADNKPEEVINNLMDFCESLDDGEHHNAVILLSSRLKQNEEKWNKKTIGDDEFDSEKNRINESLIAKIDELKLLMKDNKNTQLASSIQSLLSNTISIVKEEYERDNSNKTTKKILDRLQKIKKQCDNQTFQIAVMALLNSGKSTFLNALLDRTFLPVSNVSETAVPVRIHHSNEPDGSLYDEDKNIVAKGDEIVEYLKKKNADRRSKSTENDSEYILEAPLKILINKEMPDVKFEILDTPGFGEAEIDIIRRRGKKLKKTNQEIVDEIGAIIYLLDYAKLGMEAEDKVLGKLSQLRPDLLSKIQDRFFFIINKIDIEENADGLSVEETIDFVLNTIKSKIPSVRKEQVLPLSSRIALWSRLILSDNMPEHLMIKFKKERFGSKNKDKSYSEKELKDEAKEALEESKLINVENRIIDYIFNNRYKIYQQTLLSQLERQIVLFKNQVISTAKGTLKADKSKIEELEKKIENAKKKASKIEGQSLDFQAELQKQNYKQFEKFKRKISSDIKLLFEKTNVRTTDAFLMELIKRKIRWFDYQSKSENNKLITEKTFKALNNDIYIYVSNKFRMFKDDLANQIIEKQKELFHELQSIIDEMSAEFEKELERELDIELKPIYPKIEEFYSGDVLREVSEKIDRFITKSKKTEYVNSIKRVPVKISFCKTRYVNKIVAEAVEKESYEISETDVRTYWMSAIESMSDNAVKLTDRFVEDFIEKQIREARNSFNEYVGDYMLTVNEEKKNISSGGEEYIDSRLKHLDGIDKKLDEIEMQVSNALTQ